MVARHGLTELYAPPEGTQTVALIVFVHGLFGHPYHTWASQPSRSRSKSSRYRSTVSSSTPISANPSRSSLHLQKENHEGIVNTTDNAETTVLWPRDLLPNIVHDVRILTWGYDADIDGFSSASQSTIHQHAGSLLSDIADQRETSECYRRPIIFVVHSLGGVIVKAALNRSSAIQGTRLKDIAPATCGVCFLGTPHRGSGTASLGRVAYEITRIMTMRPNTRLLQGLEKNSETLEQIGDTFAQTMLNSDMELQVYSFREEKETRRYLFFNALVVEPDSAKIGDDHEEVGSIPSNHSQMTKFKDSEDIGFKRIAAQLRRWVQKLRLDEETLPSDIVDCMTSLSILETKFRIADVRKADKATFHWLFDPDVVSFSDWLQLGIEKSEPFYWIQGKPGSGKSTLMKFAMKDRRTVTLLGGIVGSDPQWTLVAFFFHDRGSSIQKSLVGMLREIVDSTLRQLPQLMPHAIPVYKDLVKMQGKRSPDWDLEALATLMEAITLQRTTRVKLLLFLDALDEHEGDNELLLQMLKDWTRNVDGHYVTLKICLASRSWPVFTEYLGDSPNLAIDQFTKDDICIYTKSRLSSSLEGTSQLLKPEMLMYMTEHITAKARGVFIWVRLVTDQLAKNIRDGTPFQILLKMIAEIPEELQELYDHAVRRIDSQYANETYVMFQLILCSVEPLPIETLVGATTISLDHYLSGKSSGDQWTTSDSTTDQALRWLISRSGGLLETYTADANVDYLFEDRWTSIQYVQFLHQTSKEYVQSRRAQAFMKRMAPQVAGKTGYYFLALALQSCSAWIAPIKLHMLYYIKLAEIQNQIDGRIDIPIVSGGISASHANGPCDTDWWFRMRDDPLLAYLCAVDPYGRPTQDLNDYFHYHRLSLVVAANLISMLDSEVSRSDLLPYIRAPRADRVCLLQVAIGGPHVIPAELQDRTAMVVKLLSLGYSPHTYKKIAPQLAMERGLAGPRADIVKRFTEDKVIIQPIHYLLLNCGNVQLTDDTRISILNALIDGDPQFETHTSQAAKSIPELSFMSFSAKYESAGIVRALLQHGVSTKTRDPDGWLPIDYALLRGDGDVLAAFNEVEAERLRPDFDSSMDVGGSTLNALIAIITTTLSSFGHPGLAILLARCKKHKDVIKNNALWETWVSASSGLRDDSLRKDGDSNTWSQTIV